MWLLFIFTAGFSFCGEIYHGISLKVRKLQILVLNARQTPLIAPVTYVSLFIVHMKSDISSDP